MVKINFILPCYPWEPVGGYRVVYEYANHLVKKNHEVNVIHPRTIDHLNLSDKTLRDMLVRKLEYVRGVFSKPEIHWHDIDPDVEMFFVSKPTSDNIPDADVTFATAWQTAEYVKNYPESKGQKFYLIQHYETWSGTKDLVDTTWRYPLKKIVIAKWLYDKGLEIGVPESMMVHIPNAIDTKKYQKLRDFKRRPKRVAMMYSAFKWKGARDGIKALELAKVQEPDLTAVLFGTNHRPANLPKWIEYVKNPTQDFLIRDIYNESSIYLCPSLTEGWHLPPAEAMACGCAVVSTNNTGVRDYIIDRQTGLLSPIEDPEKLAINLINLLENDDLRIKIARAGQLYIEDYFNWERSAKKLEGCILGSGVDDNG